MGTTKEKLRKSPGQFRWYLGAGDEIIEGIK